MKRLASLAEWCRAAVHAGSGLGLVALLTLAERASAQQPATPVLARVPEFRLSLPPVLAPQLPPAMKSEPLWPQYWREPAGGRAARNFGDQELRWRIETFQWQRGRWSLLGEMVSVPARERDCEANCRGPDWAPSLQLKYDAGSLGPLQQVGPSLRFGGAATGKGQLTSGGLGGVF